MAKKEKDQATKAIVGFAVTPDMTPEQVKQAIIDGFAKSGVEVPAEVLESIAEEVRQSQLMEAGIKALHKLSDYPDAIGLLDKTKEHARAIVGDEPQGALLDVINAACDFVKFMAEVEPDADEVITMLSMLMSAAFVSGVMDKTYPHPVGASLNTEPLWTIHGSKIWQ